MNNLVEVQVVLQQHAKSFLRKHKNRGSGHPAVATHLKEIGHITWTSFTKKKTIGKRKKGRVEGNQLGIVGLGTWYLH